MHKQDPKNNGKDDKTRQCQKGSEAGQKPGQKVPNLQETGDIMKKSASAPKHASDITYSQKDNISAATATGGRCHQEDFYLFDDLSMKSVKNGQGQLMAVFDGHGGADAAEQVSKAIYGVFGSMLATRNGDVNVALKDTISKLALMTSSKKAGTTLSMVYVPSGRNIAHVAVIGDSPVIILDKGNKVIVSPDHNVRTNPAELAKAQKKGALYQLGYIMSPFPSGGGLQMSRSLGDKNIAHILDREPEIYSVPLGSKSFILLGTDGLFDPGHHDTAAQVGRIAILTMNGAGARELVQDALDRMTCDNVTAIVWQPR
jgi:serine/threonine protein phosphatase PrpC